MGWNIEKVDGKGFRINIDDEELLSKFLHTIEPDVTEKCLEIGLEYNEIIGEFESDIVEIKYYSSNGRLIQADSIAILCKENKEDEFMFLMYELGIDKSKFEIINEICLC
jgi:hypothetical protein